MVGRALKISNIARAGGDVASTTSARSHKRVVLLILLGVVRHFDARLVDLRLHKSGVILLLHGRAGGNFALTTSACL